MLRTAPRALGPLAVIACAGLLTTCTNEASGPGRRGVFAVEPVLPAALHLNAFNLTIDNVRLIAVRPPSDTVYDQTTAFPAGQNTLQLSPDIPLNQSPESFEVTLQLLSGTTLLFSGTQSVSISDGTNSTPVQIPVSYAGPGQNITTLRLDPPDSILTWDATLGFRPTARDAQNNPVTSYYLSWTTSDAAVAIDPTGQVTAPHVRSTVTVTATTPTNISASTTLALYPAATAVTIVSGCGQSAAPGARLPQPVVAKVIAADNGGVGGVAVTFTPPSGGSVVPAQAVTDANGLAQTTVTLGSAPGTQGLVIGAPGLTPVPCTQTAASVATHLAFTTQPTNVAAGSPITPAVVVTALDASNNPVSSFSGTITLVLGANPGNATLGGTLSVAASSGAATFSDLTLGALGTGYALAASATGLAGATSSAFNVVNTGGTHLVFTTQPSNVFAGATIAPAIVVTAEDALNNRVVTFTDNVTLALGACPAGAALSGTATVAAVAGVASFSSLSVAKAGGCTLVASALALSSVNSATFNIAAGPPAQLAFSVEPSPVAAGAAITPAVAVAVEDALGNVVPTATDNITVAIGTNPGAATLGGTVLKAAAAGIALFTNLTLDKTGTGYTLTASSGQLAGATSTAFDVTNAGGTHLVFTTQPSNVTAGATIAPAVVVTAEDALNNVVTSFSANVTLALGACPGGATLGGTVSVAVTGGAATFNTLSVDRVGSCTLVASAPLVPTGTSGAFMVSVGPAARLVFTGQPSAVTPLVAIAPAVVVAVEDAAGNVVPTATTAVTVAIGVNPGGAALGGTKTVNAVSGFATFPNLTLNQVGAGYTLTAAATGLTGSPSAAFDVNSVTGTHLVFSVQPGNAVAGSAISPAVTVSALDGQNAVVPSFTANMTIALGTCPGGATLGGTVTMAAVSGVATFNNLSVDRAGSCNLVASSSGLVNVASAAFTVSAGLATHLVFTVEPTTVAAGSVIAPAVAVAIEDAFGNVVQTATNNVTVAFGANPGGAALGGTATKAAASGVATFTDLTLDKTGTSYTLTASSGTLSGATSTAFNVTNAGGTHLVFTTQPSPVTAGAAIAPAVVVTAEDALNNVVGSFNGNVTLALGTCPGGATLGGTATVGATAGVATFSTLTVDKAGSCTLVATAASLANVTSASFTISATAAAKLAFTVEPTTVAAGSVIAPAVAVAIEDAFGNVVLTATDNLTVAIGANPGGSALGGTATQAAVSGVASFNDLTLDKTGTGYTLTAASGSLTGAVSTTFNITNAGGTHLVFTTQPSNATAGAAITPAIVVTAEDALSNPVTSFTALVTMTVGTCPVGATLSGTAAIAASAGVATFNAISIDKAGSCTLVASSAALPSVTSSAFTIGAGAKSKLAFTVQPSNVVAGVVVAPAVSVAIEDGFGNLVASATDNVTLSIGTNPGGATLGGTATRAATGGAATFNDLTLDKTGAAYTLAAASGSLTGATSGTFDVTPGTAASVVKISGDNQNGAGGAALAQPLVVEVRDALANPVPGVTVNWSTTDGGSFTPASGPTGAGGQAQTSWTLGPSLPSQTAKATVGALNPASFSATATIGTPAISLSFAGTPGVGIGLTAKVYVDINQPAPAGGQLISLVSGNPSLLTVPASVTIAQGKTRDSVNVTGGGTAGTTTLTATASGFTDGVLTVQVESRAIALPTSINVPYGQSAQIPVQIASPAPAGGVDIDVVSDNPAAVGVQSSPIHIAAGALTQNATLLGVLPGTAIITASNPAYNFATSNAATTASLNIIQTSATLNASFGTSITINFESNGQPTAAPSPGISVTLAPQDPNCLAATSPVTIATGLVSTTGTLTYGGSATLPCTTKLFAQATNLKPDSVTVTVSPVPVITMNTPAQGTGRLGVGLQDQGSGNLQVANPGPGSLTVHLVSSDPTAVLLAPDAATAGTPSLDVQVPVNQSGFSYFIQGVSPKPATITASAPGFTNGTSPTVTVTTPGFDILSLPSSTTSLSANDPFFVRLGVPNAGNTALAAEQSVRAGTPALTATVKNRNTSAARLVTTALTGQSVTVTIQPGQARSPSTVAAGGMEYDPLGAGPDTVTATIPGFVIFPGTADSVPITVTAPLISMNTPAQGTGRLGIDLEDQGSGNLQVANPGPGSLTVHLVSSDQAVLLLAPDASTPGTPTLDVQVPITQSGFSYFVQGVGSGTATITASAPAYTNGTSPVVTVTTPGFDILSLPSSTTSLAANDPFFVRIGVPNSGGTALAAEQSLRAGATALTATVTNRTAAVAQLVTTALTGRSVTVTVQPGQARSPSTVAAGGVEYDPLGAGFDTVTATIPGFVIFKGTADSVPITVTAPSISMNTPAQGTGRLGVGLQDQGSGNLQTANPGPGSLTVHLVSSNPTALLLAPDAVTSGTPTLDVQVPVNQSGFSYFVQGIATGTATITASAPAYTNGTSPTVTVANPGFDILSLPGSTTSLSANDPFFVRLGVPNAGNTALAAEQVIRAGGSAVTATIKNRAPAAAQLVTTTTSGQQVTVQILVDQSRSPSTKATGGVEYDPLGAGFDTVTATIPGFGIFPGAPDSVAVTVTAPLISMNTPAQGTGRLGAGLQDQGSGNLQTANPGPGPLTVHLVSSQPSVVLLAPDATTLGQPTLDVQVPLNQSGFSYFIQGLEGTSGTVTITASASGYTNGTTTVTVAQPGFDILGLSTAITTLAANDQFFVRLGVPNVGHTAIAAEQNIRAGGTAVTATIKNKNTSAAQLVTTVQTGQSVTVQVAVGQARSPSTVAQGGVEYDPLAVGIDTVSASIPGFLIFQGAPDSVGVTVSTPLISMNTPAQGTGRLGVGLQDNGGGSLQTANPGPSALTVHLVSSNPSVLLIAPDAVTSGQPTLDLQLGVNQSSINYFVQGIATGTATITASATGYVDGTSPTVNVVTPGFDILSLPTSISSTAANDPFQVRIGAPNTINTAIAAEQSVRVGGSPLTVTVTSTSSTAAQLVTTATTGLSVSVSIAVGQARSPSTVASGGVAFDPLAQGSTTVSAAISGFLAMTTGSLLVNVGP